MHYMLSKTRESSGKRVSNMLRVLDLYAHIRSIADISFVMKGSQFN